MSTKTPKTPRKQKAPKAIAVAASDGQVLAIAPEPAPAPVPQAAAPAAAKPKAAKPPKEKKLSPTAEIRAALAVDSTLDPEGIKASLAKRGMHPPMSTINTVRADFLGCLKALQAAGRLKLH